LLRAPNAGEVESNRSLLGEVEGLAQVAQQFMKDGCRRLWKMWNYQGSCDSYGTVEEVAGDFFWHRLLKLLDMDFLRVPKWWIPPSTLYFFMQEGALLETVLRVGVDGDNHR
jgi:hypothetical protein